MTSETKVFWKGEVEVLDASWSIKAGRIASLRFVTNGAARSPFDELVLKRGGRLGCRFSAVFVEVATQRKFTCELMLMGGGSSLGQGYWAKFVVDADPDRHPFEGCTGRTHAGPGTAFMLALILLPDDGKPVEQEHSEERKRKPLSNYAAMMCMSPLFHKFLSETVTVGGEFKPPEYFDENDNAARYMRWRLKIESRAEMDRNQRVAENFHKLIRIPFVQWRQAGERHDQSP